jgi:hypothetical protein
LKGLVHIALKRWFLPLLFGLLVVFISFKNLAAPAGNEGYTAYNNYIIFKNSFQHLLHNTNLYIHYPAQQYDLFKYSPTFALFFAPFSVLPNGMGLVLWNALNVFVFLYALGKLKLSPIKHLGFGLLIFQEVFTTTANSQSNLLIAGLLLLAYTALEEGKTWQSVLFIWLTAFIKIFGVLFFAVVLLYPQRWKCVLPGLIVGLVLFFAPVPMTGLSGLIQHYKDYGVLLSGDHGVFVKYSVMGWLQTWFGFTPPKNTVVFIGLFIQLLPLLVISRYKSGVFRVSYAGSWLIWMVIFNHMAESATFIIAVAGILLWYFAQPRRQTWHIALLLPVMLFTCFGPSDIYPKYLRHLIVEDWQLKVFPCILVWGIMMVQMFLEPSQQRDSALT